MQGDGDGWVQDAQGGRRWGRHGAAGLLLRAPGVDGPRVLLQHRAAWSHHGGTWGVPGGARDSHESPEQAAVREAGEEAGVRADDLAVRAVLVTVPVSGSDGWSYTTVVADAATELELTPNQESTELRWVPEAQVDDLLLHPSFGRSWPGLRTVPVRLLVDVANLLGSRPDGWWRDRAGATTALLARLGRLGPRTVPLPGGRLGWLVAVAAVVEGAAREARADGVGGHGVELFRAPGSGDDEVVAQARAGDVVVTADRGLRARLPSGVDVVGPSVVREWLDALP